MGGKTCRDHAVGLKTHIQNPCSRFPLVPQMHKTSADSKNVTCAVCKSRTRWKAVTRGAPAVASTAELVAAADSGAAADPALAAVRLCFPTNGYLSLLITVGCRI